PLEHYLYYGSAERRRPNKFFNVGWYKDTYFDVLRDPQSTRVEPLTDYVTRGFAAGRHPGPGLSALLKAKADVTPYGPKLFVDCIASGQNLYAHIVHPPDISVPEFNAYLVQKDISLTQSIARYNPAFPDDMVLLAFKRIALMYTPKCASGKILFWWLEQAGLLNTALRFYAWPHEFEERYRLSREYLSNALAYEPARYRTFKFVRNPILRAVSTFTHFLMFPASFGLPLRPDQHSASFFEFLEFLKTTDVMERDGHCRPQRSKAEEDGLIRPTVLKIEDGLDDHLAAIEREFDLPPAIFEYDPQIGQTLYVHHKQQQARIAAGPAEQIRFGQIPIAKHLITPELIDRVYSIYRGDFEAYGYAPKV